LAWLVALEIPSTTCRFLDEADVAYTFNRAPEAVREGADVLVDDVVGALADLEQR
jgi:hypothetical protein